MLDIRLNFYEAPPVVHTHAKDAQEGDNFLTVILDNGTVMGYALPSIKSIEVTPLEEDE